MQDSLTSLLLFNALNKTTIKQIISEMYELPIKAGEQLIMEGDSGSAATKLFVVKSGKFEVCASAYAFACICMLGRVAPCTTSPAVIIEMLGIQPATHDTTTWHS